MARVGARENFGIVVEIDPKNEQSARDFEREAKAAMAEVAKAARDAAKEQERAARDAARAATAAVRQAAKEQDETARALTIAAERRAKERATAEIDASRKAAAAAKQAAEEQEKVARFVAKRTADYARQVASDQSSANQKLAAAYRQVVGPAAEYREKLNQIIHLERQGSITAQQRASAVRGMQREIKQFNAQQQGGVRGAVSSFASSQIGAIAAPAAIAATAVAAGREIVALSDAYQNLTNRIRTVTDSEAEAMRVRGQLLELSNRTRSDLGATTEGYVRLASATKNLNLTQSDLLGFTESLNKTIKLSGATSSEAQAGLIQFAQGLGAGALRGDELRSVMEQLGPVADVIAKKLGTTRAGLKAFGEQGKITADVVVAAFREQREEIDGKFAKSVATFSDLWTVLHNAIEAAVGQVVEAVGGMPALSAAFQDAAQWVGEYAHGLTVAIKGMRDLIAEVPALGGALVKLLGNKDVREVLFSGTIGTIGKVSDRYYANRRFGDAIAGTDAEKLGQQLAAERAQEVLDEQRRKFVATDPAAMRDAAEQFAKIGQRITDGWRDEAKAAAATAKAERDHAASVREAAAAWKEWLGGVREGGSGVLERVALRLDDVRDSFEASIEPAIEASRAWSEFGDNADRITDSIGGKLGGFLESIKGAGAAVSETLAGAAPAVDEFSKTLAESLGSGLNTALDAVVDFANGTKVSIGDMVRSVIVDLEKALLKFLAFQAIKATIGVASGGFGGILAGALGINLGNNATGGSYVVPGGGGVDSVPIYARATPGERVTFTPPGQAVPGGGAPANVNVKTVIVADVHAAGLEAMRTPAGTRVIIDAIASNPGAVRAAVGR